MHTWMVFDLDLRSITRNICQKSPKNDNPSTLKGLRVEVRFRIVQAVMSLQERKHIIN